MEKKYKLPYGVASPKDSRGIVYGKFYESFFKIGCSCEKNAPRRLKDSYKLPNKKEAEEQVEKTVCVETRFYMHLEEKFKVYLREFGFCHHEEGTESFLYRDDIPLEDMGPLLLEILEKLNKDVMDVEKMKNAHILSGFVPSSKTKEELNMTTNEGKIEASIIDATNEQYELKTVRPTEITPEVKKEQPALKIVSSTKIAPEVKKERLTKFYKTRTGKKLHIIGCHYLEQSKILATQSDIKKFEQCSRCCKKLPKM